MSESVLAFKRNLAVTANTYTHVLVDETEIDDAARELMAQFNGAPAVSTSTRPKE